MRKILALSTVVLAIASATSPAFAARKSAESELKQIESYCYNPKVSMVEGRECIAKQLNRLRKEIEKAVRKKQFEINEVAQNDTSPGTPSGEDAANQWRASFKKEQDSWADYEKYRCDNVVKFERAGGSGADGFRMSCSIRLILERLRELDGVE